MRPSFTKNLRSVIWGALSPSPSCKNLSVISSMGAAALRWVSSSPAAPPALASGTSSLQRHIDCFRQVRSLGILEGVTTSCSHHVLCRPALVGAACGRAPQDDCSGVEHVYPVSIVLLHAAWPLHVWRNPC